MGGPLQIIINDICNLITLIDTKHNLLKGTIYSVSEKYWENIGKDILNIVYGHSLIKTETLRRNYPGIDLLDECSKIGYQVTIEETSAKIHNTIESFEKNNINLECKDLRFLIISTKNYRDLYGRTRFRPNGKYSFNYPNNIITLNTIMKEVCEINNLKICETIRSTLVKYWGDFNKIEEEYKIQLEAASSDAEEKIKYQSTSDEKEYKIQLEAASSDAEEKIKYQSTSDEELNYTGQDGVDSLIK